MLKKLNIDFKKYIKIFLITMGVVIVVVLVDTLQARIFKKSPIISWKEELEDNDSWVDKSLIIDTYYCTKEKDIVTIFWKLKGSKFTCPIDNVSYNEISKEDEKLISLLKSKMIEDNILIESNLESFNILSIYEYGYYRDKPNKKYIEFNFRYTCKDKTKNCITKSATMFSTISSVNDYNIIWAYTDGRKIYELSKGVSIGFNDDFVFLQGEKRIIGVIK